MRFAGFHIPMVFLTSPLLHIVSQVTIGMLRIRCGSLYGISKDLSISTLCFLLLFHNKLLTNSQYVHRRISLDSFYTRCGFAKEASLYALKDCMHSKQMWKHFLGPSYSSLFFSSSLHALLKVNLSNSSY